jgi:hypothetical protein
LPGGRGCKTSTSPRTGDSTTAGAIGIQSTTHTNALLTDVTIDATSDTSPQQSIGLQLAGPLDLVWFNGGRVTVSGDSSVAVQTDGQSDAIVDHSYVAGDVFVPNGPAGQEGSVEIFTSDFGGHVKGPGAAAGAVCVGNYNAFYGMLTGCP